MLEKQLGATKLGQETSNLKLTEMIEKQKRQISQLSDDAINTKRSAESAVQDLTKAHDNTKQQLESSASRVKALLEQDLSKSQALNELSQQFEELSDKLIQSGTRSRQELAERDDKIARVCEELAEAERARDEALAKAGEPREGEDVWKQKMGEFEGVVDRLAAALRVKEAMVQTLQGTVQRECEERHALQAKMIDLEAQLQSKQGSRHGTRESARHGGNNRVKLPQIN
eukprot:TRINITY_DN22867_c0_g1_i3.p2 TRINITY_DN22867_c0_g1~~TRINITY_DN22867_c0_g1_i3.p2  ORF type:complete len:229 (-),score=68.32 TRINITY_DN22867_c0_g1_i3:58-744(-)